MSQYTEWGSIIMFLNKSTITDRICYIIHLSKTTLKRRNQSAITKLKDKSYLKIWLQTYFPQLIHYWTHGDVIYWNYVNICLTYFNISDVLFLEKYSENCFGVCMCACVCMCVKKKSIAKITADLKSWCKTHIFRTLIEIN